MFFCKHCCFQTQKRCLPIFFKVRPGGNLAFLINEITLFDGFLGKFQKRFEINENIQHKKDN